MSYVVTARDASSTLTPRTARSRSWPSYAVPCAMACAKIVGFDVTPRTWKSLASMARLPVVSRSRLMSSSQIATSSAVS